jgi:hypothetical protein
MDVAASLRGPEIAGLCDRNRPMAWVEVRGTQSWKAVGVRAGYGPGGLTGTVKDQRAAKSLCSILALIYHYASPALPVSKGAEGRTRCGSPNGRDGGADPGYRSSDGKLFTIRVSTSLVDFVMAGLGTTG